jgi:hypothetical protein
MAARLEELRTAHKEANGGGAGSAAAGAGKGSGGKGKGARNSADLKAITEEDEDEEEGSDEDGEGAGDSATQGMAAHFSLLYLSWREELSFIRSSFSNETVSILTQEAMSF